MSHHYVIFFFLKNRRPPISTLFPYTTLFRSLAAFVAAGPIPGWRLAWPRPASGFAPISRAKPGPRLHLGPIPPIRAESRSEEHTSELQSPCNLVCSLLLEKQKNATYDSDSAH